MKLFPADFSFISPRIVYGAKKINDLGKETLTLFENSTEKLRACLVTGKNSLKSSGYTDKIIGILEKSNISTILYDEISKEPTTTMVNQGKEIVLAEKCNLIIGAGGGSVMDTAKAMAGLATNGGIVEDYHAGKEFNKSPLPFILIPTTSGTGSEVTNNAVIKNEKEGIKKSVRGLYANLALLDPEVTLSLSKKYTAYPGADALVQAIESLVSLASNFISDLFARKSIELLGPTLPKVCDELSNLELRDKMMAGSLMGALSFANGKLGAVHGFAHPIGMKHDIAHGLICGLLLPYVMEYNLEVEIAVKRYAWIAKTFYKKKILLEYGDSQQELPTSIKGKAEWAIEKIKDIFSYIGIPLHLKEIGIKENHFDNIVADTTGSSLANNPRETDKESLKAVLLRAL